MEKLIDIDGHTYVIGPIQVGYGREEPNFRGTGMALLGALKRGETLDGWRKRRERIRRGRAV